MNATTMRPRLHTRLTYWAIVNVGIVASAYISYQHFVVLRNPLYFPWCDIGARVACTPAYVSRFGYVFGLPVGPLLTVLFAVCALILASRGAEDQFRGSAIFAVTILAVAVGVYQMFGTAVLLHLFCIPCIAMHATSLALFALSSDDAKMSAKEFILFTWRYGRSGASPLIAGVAAGVLFAGVIWFFPESRPTTGISAASDLRDR